MLASSSIRPAFDVSLTEQAQAFSLAFSDYVTGPVRLDAEAMARFVSGHGVDLWHSRLVMQAGEIVGFGYINRTGEVSRLAAMGVVPAVRDQGVGQELLRKLIEESRSRRDRLMVLEVFEQNPPALALYRKFGFHEVRRLLGWSRNGGGSVEAAPLEEVSVLEAGQHASVFEYPSIPWQVSLHAAAKLPPGVRVFCLGNSVVFMTNPEDDPITIRMLHQARRGQPSGPPDWTELRRVIESLVSKFKNRRWSAPAIFPEEFGTEVFQPLGFTREPLNQFQMELVLEASNHLPPK